MADTLQQGQPGSPKKKSKACLWIVLIVIFLILATGAYYFLKIKKSEDTESPTATVDLSVKEAKIDKDKAVTKTFGQDGGTISTRASDGTLYTLTVPGDALILPAEVSMSPLTESPVTGIDNPSAGYGVYLNGSFSFIRPAFITIQPNTEIPEYNIAKATTWGRCTIASRGYDPEICIGEKNIPFAGGIEPGKVVVMATNTDDDKRILLSPTIPIGETNVYNAEVYKPAAYFGTIVDKKLASKLAEKTFADSFEYINATEVLMHLLTLGGDLTPYKDEVARFERGEKSYPRETLKGAILAKALNDEETYQSRIDDFKSNIDKNITNARGSFYISPRYVALLKQLQISRQGSTSFLSIKAKASSDLGEWPDSLPDYDENARSDTGGSSWASNLLASLNQRYRDILGSSIYSCSEKAWASESLEMLGTIDAADREAINTILGKCADQCKTLEECERQSDIATKNGNTDAATAAIYRMTAFLEKSTDCTSQTKKTLETYGQNFCN